MSLQVEIEKKLNDKVLSVSFDTEDEKNRCSHGGCLDHRFIIMQRIVKKSRGADQTV
mgnify:FL=1